MNKNRLDESALEVTEFCLGTMTWGEQTSEREAHEQIAWALDRGINFVDTANALYPSPAVQ
ncbi:MAG: aldo/keto reductase [Pseudomonadota bacterium]